MDVASQNLRKAVRLHQSGQLDAADGLYQQILRIDPHHTDALHLAGVVAHQQRNHRRAIELISRAIQHDDQVASFHSNLGLAQRELGDTNHATDSFREAIRIQPGYAGAHYNLGMSLEAEGDLDAAANAYQDALQCNPDFEQAINNLGNVLLRLGRVEGAIQQFETLAERQPDSAETSYNLANAYVKASRPFDAFKALERAIEVNPNYTDAHNNLGLLHRDLGDLDLAAECFQRVLEIEPDHADALSNIGTLRADRLEFDEAIESFEQALAARPHDAEILCNLGHTWSKKLDFQTAIEFFELALEEDDSCARAHLLLGRTAAFQGDGETACAHYRRGIELDPDNAQAWESLGKFELAGGNYSKGADAFGESVSRRPGEDALRFQYGAAQLLAGEFADARSTFAEAIRSAPDMVGAWNNLGHTWNATGDLTKARACYQKAVNVKPDFAQGHSNLAEALRIEGKLDEADAHYTEALRHGCGNRIRVLQAIKLPPIPTGVDEIDECRRRLSDNIDRLIDDGVVVDPVETAAPNLFYLAYHGRNDRELLKRYSKLFRSSYRPDFEPNDRTPRHDDGKLHIGFVSKHFHNHTIGFFTRGLIRNLDRTRFHVSTFSVAPPRDEIGREIERDSDDYFVTSEQLPMAHKIIADQKPDVLFYSDLGMDAVTFGLAHSRLAPRQCVTWGHPVTTGLNTIDEFISCDLIEPADADQHYAERLVRLSRFPTFYARPILPPKPMTREQFGFTDRQRIYLCPQSLFKLHPDIDRVFAEILRNDSDGVIVLVRGLHKRWNQVLQQRFERTLGDVAERVLLLPRQGHGGFMSLLAIADVMLDPLHFGGGNTSYQATALGVPIVTCPSAFMRGRATAGLYQDIGVTDTIADSHDEFVRRCLQIAGDRDQRQDIHERILANCDRLFEDKQAVQELEEHFLN